MDRTSSLPSPVIPRHYTKHISGVEIEVNKNCNLSCVYCPNSQHAEIFTGSTDGAMSMGEFGRILDQVDELRPRKIMLHRYGEPLLIDIEKYIRAVFKRVPGTLVIIYTNGTLINKKRLSSLARVAQEGPLKIIVTAHTKAQESRAAMEGLPRMGALGFDERVATFPSGLLDAFDTDRHGDGTGLYVRTTRDLNLTSRAGAGRAGARRDAGLEHCGADDSPVITYRGDVLRCADDYFGKEPLGNIWDRPLRKILTDPGYTSSRVDLQEGRRDAHHPCNSCVRTSSGGARNYDRTGLEAKQEQMSGEGAPTRKRSRRSLPLTVVQRARSA